MEIRLACDTTNPQELTEKLCATGMRRGYTPQVRKREYVLDVHISYQWRTPDHVPITYTSSREIRIRFLRSRWRGLYWEPIFSAVFHYPVIRRDYGKRGDSFSTQGEVTSLTVSANGRNDASPEVLAFLDDFLNQDKRAEFAGFFESQTI